MEERAALLTRVSADSGTEIKDPATGEAIGRVAFGTPGDVAAAVGTAVAAQPGWAALSDQERCDALMRAADAIDGHAEELAYVVSREQGKTMNGLGARYEAAGCAAWVRATAGTPLPAEVLVDEPANHAELHYRPIGVVGIDPRVPFGGAKHSGYGLEFGVEGLKAVSVPQVISG